MASIGSPLVRFQPDEAGHAASRAMGGIKAVVLPGRLDAAIAAGADPESDPALRSRSRRLTRPRYRQRLALSVERMIEEIEAEPGSYLLSSAVPVRRDQVAAARGTLLSIAGALRDLDSVDPRGVALTLRLVTDPASPLYSGTAEAFQARAREALECLIAGRQPWCDLPAAPPMPTGGGLDEHR